MASPAPDQDWDLEPIPNQTPVSALVSPLVPISPLAPIKNQGPPATRRVRAPQTNISDWSVEPAEPANWPVQTSLSSVPDQQPADLISDWSTQSNLTPVYPEPISNWTAQANTANNWAGLTPVSAEPANNWSNTSPVPANNWPTPAVNWPVQPTPASNWYPQASLPVEIMPVRSNRSFISSTGSSDQVAPSFIQDPPKSNSKTYLMMLKLIEENAIIKTKLATALTALAEFKKSANIQ